MRVAFYQGTFQPGQDGTMTTMSRMVDALWAAGIDHLVFTPLPPPPSAKTRTTVVPMPRVAFPAYSDYAVALPWRRTVWKELDEYAPDLVQLGTPDLGGRCVLKWALKNNVPAIGAYHTHFPTYLRYYKVGFLEGALWKYFRWFYGSCARTMVPTAPILEELRARGIERLEMWPRGVDTKRFNPNHRSEALREAAGVPPGGILFAYAGRLVSEKNVEPVAQAWASIRNLCPKARFMWIGDGPRRDVVRKIAPDGFFPGYLQDGALTQAYASADVLVFCSVTETFGNVILEGMASGLPAVAVRGTGPGAVVRHDETGLLIAAPEPLDIATAMQRLYEEDSLRRALATNALRFAQKQTWQAVFDRQFQLYKEVLDEHRGKPRG